MNKRIYLPNTTQTPNDILDNSMKQLSGSEFKVIMAILRKTLGWHKWADYISISQIMEATGLSNRQSINCVNSLEKKGFIRTKKSKRTTTLITINFTEASEESSQGGENSSLGSEKSSLATGEKSSHTKPSIKPNNTKYVEFVDLWNELYGTRLKVTESKRKQIRARLETFTQDEIMESMRNRVKDEWLNGDGKKFLKEWTAFWRSDEKIERYLNSAGSEGGAVDAWAKDGWKPAVL
jgi:phage replication O-like protein O